MLGVEGAASDLGESMIGKRDPRGFPLDFIHPFGIGRVVPCGGGKGAETDAERQGWLLLGQSRSRAR